MLPSVRRYNRKGGPLVPANTPRFSSQCNRAHGGSLIAAKSEKGNFQDIRSGADRQRRAAENLRYWAQATRFGPHDRRTTGCLEHGLRHGLGDPLVRLHPAGSSTDSLDLAPSVLRAAAETFQEALNLRRAAARRHLLKPE